MTNNIESMIVEIASFYSDSSAALKLMIDKKVYERSEDYLKHLLKQEKSFFLKRVAQGFKGLKSVEVLENRLNSTSSIGPIPGYGLRLPAYQAEMYYQGSFRFWYE